MWNKRAYDAGGLPFHAGCKVVPTDRGERTMVIVGLSGTGKTTSTFTVQNGSPPRSGRFHGDAPRRHTRRHRAGVLRQNVRPGPRERAHYLRGGHSAFRLPGERPRSGSPAAQSTSTTTPTRRMAGPCSAWVTWVRFRDAATIGRMDALLILNRNENVIPAVARLTGGVAAAFFMLGETQGTSAGGKDEAGQFLRVPGTNPFFPHGA